MKARRRTRNRTATTDHAEEILAILYRLGGATSEQAGAMLHHLDPERWTSAGGPYEAAKRTLRVLREEGMAEAIGLRRTWIGKVNGRPENFYRLRRAGGGEGILAGAAAAGAPGDRAALNYRRVWSGGGVAHAALRADYFLALLEGTLDEGTDLGIDLEAMWSESNPAYPLVGARLAARDAAGRRIGARANARRLYSRTVPDGEWELRFPGRGGQGAVCPFYVEVERRTNAALVAEKLGRYAGRWARLLREEGVLEARPIVVLHHDGRRAWRTRPREGAGAEAMRDSLRRLLAVDGHFGALQEYLVGRDEDADLGRMVVVCDWDDVAREGAFAANYHPVGRYPGEGLGPIHLESAVAEYRSMLASHGSVGTDEDG